MVKLLVQLQAVIQFLVICFCQHVQHNV